MDIWLLVLSEFSSSCCLFDCCILGWGGILGGHGLVGIFLDAVGSSGASSLLGVNGCEDGVGLNGSGVTCKPSFFRESFSSISTLSIDIVLVSIVSLLLGFSISVFGNCCSLVISASFEMISSRVISIVSVFLTKSLSGDRSSLWTSEGPSVQSAKLCASIVTGF